MSKIRFLDKEETKVLLQVKQWLDDHFFIPENKFDEEYFEKYMRAIIDNTKEMYDAVYFMESVIPSTVLIYNYVLDIITCDAQVSKRDREVVELTFTTWLASMTDRTFEEIFEWLISESYKAKLNTGDEEDE